MGQAGVDMTGAATAAAATGVEDAEAGAKKKFASFERLEAQRQDRTAQKFAMEREQPGAVTDAAGMSLVADITRRRKGSK